MSKEKVSIIIVVRNEEEYIRKCILNILDQSYKNFELIIVDDFSTDETPMIIKELSDKRIKYLRNKSNLGIANSRNIALKKAEGKYVFFTDGDCMPIKNWLEEGVEWFKKNKCVSIQGRVYYEKSMTSVSDRIKSNESGKFMTANMAFIKSAITELEGFDPQFNYAYEDVDLALRTTNIGCLDFCEKMIVIHRHVEYTVKRYFEDCDRVKELMLLIKKHGKKARKYIKMYLPDVPLKGKILYPLAFIAIFFPPLILLNKKFNSIKELKWFFIIYLGIIKKRIVIWKTAIKEKMLFI